METKVKYEKIIEIGGRYVEVRILNLKNWRGNVIEIPRARWANRDAKAFEDYCVSRVPLF